MNNTEYDPESKALVAGFRQEFRQLGWMETRNIRIQVRYAAGKADQYQALAKELVALQPDAILAYTTPVAAALQRESRTIPIVFVQVSDPVGSGLVTSLARPDSNLTGLLLYERGITGEWVAMLKEIAPHLERTCQGGRDHRNPRPASIGIGGRLRSESPADFVGRRTGGGRWVIRLKTRRAGPSKNLSINKHIGTIARRKMKAT
jgi:ABC transporter substrate binding protein